MRGERVALFLGNSYMMSYLAASTLFHFGFHAFVSFRFFHSFTFFNIEFDILADRLLTY